VIHFIFKNWQAKLGSFLVSLVLYINLQNSKIIAKEYFIPIKYPPLTGNLSYSQKSKTVYNVRLEGKEELINLHLPELKILIDQEDIQAGENEIEVKKIDGLPQQGISFFPLDGKIKVTIDTVDTKTIPLDIQFEGDPTSNYIMASHSVSPNAVTISGPTKILEKWNRYNLGKISLADKKESFTKKLKLYALPKDLQFVSKPKEVTVKINIVKVSSEVGEQVVVGIPVQCEGLAEELIADLSHNDISIKFSSVQVFNTIQIMQGIKATVSCTNKLDRKTMKILPDKKASVKVKVNKSLALAKLDVVTTVPEKITVTYSVKPDYQKKKENEEIKDKNTEEKTVPKEKEPVDPSEIEDDKNEN
jgi:hypothetical protein